jgi:hypothetical protein
LIQRLCRRAVKEFWRLAVIEKELCPDNNKQAKGRTSRDVPPSSSQAMHFCQSQPYQQDIRRERHHIITACDINRSEKGHQQQPCQRKKQKSEQPSLSPAKKRHPKLSFAARKRNKQQKRNNAKDAQKSKPSREYKRPEYF